ncbi:MAG: hypothetical protein PF638_16105 [Candidatus Delongbacteria bacterium]|nr:hypothetical protein [Candidatus Delongbacteria bacterium]
MGKRAKRIMFVDDDYYISIYADYFAEIGYEIYNSRNVNNCLEFLSTRKQIDLFVIDIALPISETNSNLEFKYKGNYIYSGLDLGRRIRERRPKTPILFFTGISHKERLDIIKNASVRIPLSMVILKHEYVLEEDLGSMIEKIIKDGFESIYEKSFLSKLKNAILFKPNFYGIGLDFEKLKKGKN